MAVAIGDTVNIVNDGLRCKILEVIPHDVQEILSHLLSFHVQGYFFTQAYQSRGWDGKKKLYQPVSQVFHAGLLDKVIGILKSNGISAKVTLGYTRSQNAAWPFMGKLRQYQLKAMTELLQYDTGVLHCPPRSGKTVMAGYLISKVAVAPVVFFVERLDLAYQTIEELKVLLGETLGLVGDGVADVKPITVVTMQSASSAYDQRWDLLTKRDLLEKEIVDKVVVRNLIENARMCIYDECHHSASGVAQEILNKMKKASFRYGLSATPYREDNADMLIERMLGPIRTQVSYSELINEGFLVRPHIMMHHLPPSSDDGGYQTIYRNHVVENAQRNLIIKNTCEALVRKGRSVIVIVREIKHGKILTAMMNGCELLTGQEDSKRRNRMRARIANKEVMLCVSTILDEGVNLPSLDAVVIAEGGKSSIATFQRLRCLTPYEGKKEATVVDFYDHVKFLDTHSRRRLALYKSEPEFVVEEYK